MVAPASPAAVVTFGLPVLAWGAMAAVVPVLIHLVLRQRPRRQVLPTLRFLIAAHEASTRAHRLRQFLLLACRMAAILLVVGLLMKTGWAPTGGTPAAARTPIDGPVSAVIAVDDSASMQYRYQGRTRLEDAVSWARNLLADPDRFPSGSEVAVVTGSTMIAPGVGWTRDFGAASRFLNGLGPEWHDRSAAALLRRAYGLIALGTRPRREVYLFTDLTEASWREPPPDPPAELARLIILDVGKTEDRNLALGLPEVPASVVPAEQGSGGRVRVRSGRADHAGTVLLEVDGQPRDRQSLNPLGPHREITLNFAIPPLSNGPHALSFVLEPDDSAPFDNRRFACLSAGKSPEVVVVGDEDVLSVATMISAMIAPPAQPPDQRWFALRRLTGPALGATPLEPALAVILADPTGLASAAWPALSAYVSAGGTLLLIPGDHAPGEIGGSGDDLLPAPIRGVISPPEPITVAAADLTGPYLRPFADPSIDSINDRLVYRRLDLGPLAAGGTVIASFSDRSPALLERRVGAGRVIQFAFSPARQWSQFGTQAAPMIVLLHAMLESLAPRPENIDSFLAGRSASHRWVGPVPSSVPLTTPDGTTSPLDFAGDTVVLPTRRPGHYRLRSGDGSTILLLYAVNTAESESDLTRLGDDDLTARFPPGLVQIAHDPDRLPARRSGADGPVSWTVPLALALAGLLWIETLFANRFYGRRSNESK